MLPCFKNSFFGLYDFLRGMALLVGAFFVVMLPACADSNAGQPTEPWAVEVQLPAVLEIERGANCTIAQKNGAFTAADVILLERQGRIWVCRTVAADTHSIEFAIPSDFTATDGQCTLYARRNNRRIKLGTVTLRIITNRITPNPGTTVYGTVEADGLPVAGAVVSDGLLCTVTDSRGVYQLPTDRTTAQWVTVSVPSGYEPLTDGCIPLIHQPLSRNTETAQIADFKLKKVSSSQDSYTLLFMGDMHLANRSADLQQFAAFAADAKALMASRPGQRFYAVTLGDMSWDTYWTKNGFSLPNYRSTIAKTFTEMPVYQTMGNHDHDPASAGADNAPVGIFTAQIAPAWYSFNIGRCHFVVMDNIDTSAYTGNGTSSYTERLYGRQLDWLQADLSHVPTSTPVFVIMHANVFSYSGTNGFSLKGTNTRYADLLNILAPYTAHIVTGHTHQAHRVTPADAVAGGRQLYEHNIAAVCGDWWYSGYYTPGSNISTDGTPYGYGVWEVNGTDIRWKYKGTGMSENTLFRAYDLNNVHFDTNVFTTLQTPSVIADFKRRYVDTYTNRQNQILINVWGWDNQNWDISVTMANGQQLPAKRIEAYDPLSIRALSIPYYNRSNLTEVPGTKTTLRNHFFQVTAPDADSPVTIRVTDRLNGITQTQTMQRPCPF